MTTPPHEQSGRICVLGMGHVGLTLAAVLADSGHAVTGVDVSEHVIGELSNGRVTFNELGLESLLAGCVGRTLTFASRIPDPGPSPSAYIVCVGTPIDDAHRRPVFDDLWAALSAIAAALRPGDIVILRSTVPVGTSRRAIRHLEDASGLHAGGDFQFGFVPERTVEGNALHEIRNLPQVAGAFDESSRERIRAIFSTINAELVFLPDVEHAEMVKMVDNTSRDVRFAYANQIALICERLSLDMRTVVDAANWRYPRNDIPVPSPGVGGACLSKDPYILADLCDRIGVSSSLVRAAREINEWMPVWLAEKLVATLQRLGKPLATSKVFVMGCAFKGTPVTSDVRSSNTWDFIQALRDSCPAIAVYDAVARPEELVRRGYPPCSIADGFRGADAVVIINDHPSHVGLPLAELAATANRPLVLFDAWRLYERAQVEEVGGIVYGSIGAC